jgi:hypothetical protein
MGALNDVLEEAVRMTAEATVAEIERLARQAAVGLLNAVLPPIVHTNAGAVKATGWAALTGASGVVGLALTTADVGNSVLAGAVAGKVRQGVEDLTSNNDYAQGVNSIAW